jgi:uncharacterized repeat protein (TIGR03803 family)
LQCAIPKKGHMKRSKISVLLKWRPLFSVVVLMLAGSALSLGQKETVLYRFKGGSDGINPQGSLIADQAGNLYGTTYQGGASDLGTIYQLKPPHWAETVLYSFKASNDGYAPVGSLVFDQAGNLYGVTVWGGSENAGTIFELTPQGGNWTETVIYNFPSGAGPQPGLLFDSAGNLYGVTNSGGENNLGAIFQMTPSRGSWTQTVIYSFVGGKHGYAPMWGPIMDKEGKLFGLMDVVDGFHAAIYELRPPANHGDSWTERVLFNFESYAFPYGQLLLDHKGNLDGVTGLGGAGFGTVFQLTRGPRGSWTGATLYTFTGTNDGWAPEATLITDHAGNLYGTTELGGSGGMCQGSDYSCGVVFRLAPPPIEGGAWTETVLHNFSRAEKDGNQPQTSLIRDKTGALYGTTQLGGTGRKMCNGAQGCGTVYRIRLGVE